MQVEEGQTLEPTKNNAARPRQGRSWISGLLVLLVASAILSYVIVTGLNSRARAESALARQTDQLAIPSVAVIHPRSSHELEEIALPGNMQAFTDTPIYARASGYLRKWYVDIGAHVRSGELLADIETPEIDRQLQQAKADLATAQANLDLAQSTAKRYQFLLKTDSVSQQVTDEKVSDLAAKKAIVNSMMSNEHRLEEIVSFEKVYAPFDGVITARNVDIGALIDAGANAPGKELFHEAATNVLRVYVSVPETYWRVARPGVNAGVTLAEFPGRTFRGSLVRTSDAIDMTSRTLLVEVDVNNSTGELLPGAYAMVHLKLPSRTNALTVPVNALIFRAEGLQVAVVRNRRVELKNVKMGRDFGNDVEIINGLSPADQVIVNPSDSISTGEPVQITRGSTS
ncbi:MAG TPA: efflux RND transporter periplasmic adaptor subunit [Bryobacteraceae bacterium]|jgi:RND family efflux transporter MFP subunit|nr:efflux RND transporter periplasmic adaptor subunit [Bryobacteraceae bacterium]